MTEIKAPNATIDSIDITPTWSGLLGALLVVYTDGDPNGRTEALRELQRMAVGADKYNDLVRLVHEAQSLESLRIELNKLARS